MAQRRVIVDGSNLATEGRSMPSLAQLDQAVREFIAENPGDEVTVVVDASFGHRIDPSEVAAFEEAESAGEVVSPPAGAIGRGDAFLLRIAEKVGATVLSNDSFQEFHGEHAWLFEKGRLLGGKPVPGVGWIFMERSPVRGAKSREVVKEAKRRRRSEASPEAAAQGADEAAPKAKPRAKVVDRAIARATKEAVETHSEGGPARRSGRPPAEPVNEPLAFITFVAAHPLGSEVVGSVVEYSSHGAFVDADGARCYIPLSAMGDPPPRRAREVVTKGEARSFTVQAFDPQRRGIELALPGFEHIAGEPTPETVDADMGLAEPDRDEETAAPVKVSGRRKKAAKAAPAEAEPPEPPARSRRRAAPPTGEPEKTDAVEMEAPPARPARGRKAAAPKATAASEGDGAPAVGSPGGSPGTEVAPAAPAKKRVSRKAASPTAGGAAEAVAAPAKKRAAARKKAADAPAAPPEEPAAKAAKKAPAARKVAATRKAAPEAPSQPPADPAPAKRTRKTAKAVKVAKAAKVAAEPAQAPGET